MIERMEQISDTLRSVLDFTHNSVHGDNFNKNRLVSHEDKANLPRGIILLEFPHFDGKNPTAWIFKAKHFFEFH